MSECPTFSTGMSKSVLDQAICRVYWIGQQELILVYEYFNTVLVASNKLKSIPRLTTEIECNELVVEDCFGD